MLVNCFYDFQQWTGEDAKFFEGCSQSSKEDVSVYSKDRDESINYLMGAEDETTLLGTSCTPKDGFWPIFGPSETGRVEKRMLFNLLHWMSRSNEKKAVIQI